MGQVAHGNFQSFGHAPGIGFCGRRSENFVALGLLFWLFDVAILED